MPCTNNTTYDPPHENMCRRFWWFLLPAHKTIITQKKPPNQNQQHCVLVHTHVCAHQQHHIQHPTTAAATQDQKPGNCSNIMNTICLSTHMFVFTNNTTYDPPHKKCVNDSGVFCYLPRNSNSTKEAAQAEPTTLCPCAHTCVCSPTPHIAQVLHCNTSWATWAPA